MRYKLFLVEVDLVNTLKTSIKANSKIHVIYYI